MQSTLGSLWLTCASFCPMRRSPHQAEKKPTMASAARIRLYLLRLNSAPQRALVEGPGDHPDSDVTDLHCSILNKSNLEPTRGCLFHPSLDFCRRNSYKGEYIIVDFCRRVPFSISRGRGGTSTCTPPQASSAIRCSYRAFRQTLGNQLCAQLP